jgi:MoxR-like ATPase
MDKTIHLRKGDISNNGQVTILDEDRLCYLVKSVSKGAEGYRTISKALLQEFVSYIEQHPEVPINEVRFKISGTSKIDKYEYGYGATLGVMAKMVLGQEGITNNNEGSEQTYSKLPLQQIIYGAPGTGKSKTIKNSTEQAEKEGRVFRTTFHPDSDYSTFVGCYKPGMKSSDRIYSAEELAVKLKEIKNSGVTYPCHKFAAQYWRSLKDLSADTIKQILIACGVTESMNVEVSKGVAIGQEYLNKDDDGKIIYTFTPQAFTNAYVKAWDTEEDVYLIIEEINRGNCAQIFGDLFQLLDRKNGVSEYPIDADADLANYLSKKLASSTHKDITDEIREGKKLKLPSNLYIWATMNTSDQNLFPIDSAFKRRWDWTYMKIKNHPEENYKIKLSDKEYDWWEFIQRINEIIASMTSSADKQLGYFFCKAAGDGTISPETFVSKVIFYLWNDVFKDYGFEDASLFRYKNDKDEMKDLTFPDFYNEAGEKVNETRLKDFLDKVLNWKKDDNKNND